METIQQPNQKKKININDLEYQLRKLADDYYDIDGYILFYETIMKLEEEKLLIPIKNRQMNGKTPALPLYYWTAVKLEKQSFDRMEMLKKKDLFDFSYYERHPEWQTKEEWERIENLYRFLKSVEERADVSIEERSLELFGHEKFLTDEKIFPAGQSFLKRIGISLEQLRVVKYGEPFVYWLKQGTDIHQIKRVLIVENLSFFHTCVHLLEQDLLDYEPELIIYGEGSKIERSFSFFFRMFEEKPYLFYYAGDLDAEGYSIYSRLVGKYPGCTIQPALKIYRKMLECAGQANEQIGQTLNPFHRDTFFDWFEEDERAKLMELWNEAKRIPQEVLTIETWRRWM